MSHTPLPWKVENYSSDGICITGADGHLPFPPPISPNKRDNAELIVRAVNSHQALIDALDIDALERGCMATYAGGYHDEREYGIFRHGMQTVINEMRSRASAALALAKGEA